MLYLEGVKSKGGDDKRIPTIQFLSKLIFTQKIKEV